jgi:hypothetical protein
VGAAQSSPARKGWETQPKNFRAPWVRCSHVARAANVVCRHPRHTALKVRCRQSRDAGLSYETLVDSICAGPGVCGRRAIARGWEVLVMDDAVGRRLPAPVVIPLVFLIDNFWTISRD